MEKTSIIRHHELRSQEDEDYLKKDLEEEEVLKEKIAMDDVRNSAKKLKSAFLGQMEAKLSEMMDDVVDSLEKSNSDPNNLLFNSESTIARDKRKSSIAGKLPEKIFRSRESPLTDLLKIPHFKTIHHIFIATLSLFMIHALVIDLLKTGTIDFGFERLSWVFGQRERTIFLLFSMNFCAICILYPCFYFWATYRQQFVKELRSRIDVIAGASFIIFILSFMYIPASTLFKKNLPPASSAAVSMEQCRLLMKMYAFVRSNLPRALNFQAYVNSKSSSLKQAEILKLFPEVKKVDENMTNEEKDVRQRTMIERDRDDTVIKRHKSENNERFKLDKRESWISWDDEESPCPDFSKYFYFLFAPTLIYKDNYPRTNFVRWNVVCWNFAQCAGCIVYANFLTHRFSHTIFSKFGLPDHSMNLTQLVDVLFTMMLPGTMCLILGFFLLLHAWQNAFAEMLCFGDRLFYKDWWNCSSFSAYYKTWNLLVHDWLYTYVFKDAWEYGLGKLWGPLPTTLVFLISSLFHEYIISVSFYFFFPVLLVLFGGFGFAFVFVKTRKSSFGNVLMWMSLVAGTGIIHTLYSMEYYARVNCPPTSDSFIWNPYAIAHSIVVIGIIFLTIMTLRSIIYSLSKRCIQRDLKLACSNTRMGLFYIESVHVWCYNSVI